MVSETDRDLLEGLLDDEVKGPELERLQRRLEAEPELAEALDELRGARSARLEAFVSMEADDREAERLLDAVRRARRRDGWRWAAWRRLAYGAGVAACIGGGFLAGAGWMGSLKGGGDAVRASSPALYQVELRDEEGRFMAVQEFDSLDKAREFSNDLQQWSERQQRLMRGAVTVRSAEF